MNKHNVKSPFDLSRISSIYYFVFLVLCTFLLIAQTTFAQQPNRWFYVAEDVNGTRFYLDRKTTQSDSNKLRVWGKDVYSDDSYRISLVEWNCAEKKYFIIDVAIYAPDGSFIGKDKAHKWILVTPDSVSEGLFQTICSVSLQSALSSDIKTKAQIIVRQANIRQSPDKNSHIIKRAVEGEQFLLANDEPGAGGWYRVFISDAVGSGWLHGSTIKLVP